MVEVRAVDRGGNAGGLDENEAVGVDVVVVALLPGAAAAPGVDNASQVSIPIIMGSDCCHNAYQMCLLLPRAPTALAVRAKPSLST